LCAGTYTVTVTDANACISIATTVVTSPNPIIINIDTITAETCDGNDGAVALTVMGGMAPYGIDLANFTSTTTYSNSTGNFTDLNAGKYIVNVTDTNGCAAICATTFIIDGCNSSDNSRVLVPNIVNPTLVGESGSKGVQISYQTSENTVNISILDSKGKNLLNKEDLKGIGNLKIPTNEWTKNAYWVILRGENNQLIQTKKIILSE